MSLFKGREDNKLERCNLIETGDIDPIVFVSDVLKRSGVRKVKVEKQENRIRCRIGSFMDRRSCKLLVRVYPQKENSLVEVVCEGSWRRPGYRILSDYLAALNSNLDEAAAEEAGNRADSGARGSTEKTRKHARSGELVLFQDLVSGAQ